ncbi:hypothetical protein BD560DRAFT_441663 [Blakeslea trispora]|nr:hypothetical protein BD560DRAFT_441663 [Blakeslea trispora]
MSHQAKPNRPLRKNAKQTIPSGIRGKQRQSQAIGTDQSSRIYLEEMKKKGYGKNGQELLRLKAFNPILDTPVELLHTLPLGVGKGLLQLWWQEILTKLKGYFEPQRLFCCRDFKQFIQVLPAILRRSIPNIPKGHKLDLIAECFDTLGSLTSLLYMRSSFPPDFRLDNHLFEWCIRRQDPVITTQASLLHHLKEDIISFWDSGSGSLFPGWFTTQDNNIVMRRTTTVVQGLATEIELVQRFDMHLSLKIQQA